MERSEPTFHEHIHVLYDLRNYLPNPNVAATYVEIGVWKGLTSILMATHPKPTEVFALDMFGFNNQMEEGREYLLHFNVSERVHRIKRPSNLGVIEVLPSAWI